MPGLGAAAALALLAGTVFVVSVAAEEEDVVRGRLIAEAGRAVVEVTIAPGWHVNAPRPRDAFMIPTTVTIHPPAGVQAGPVDYPPPKEKRLAVAGDRPVLLYEGVLRFTAPLEGTPAPGAPPLRATVRYQACDATRCLPPRTLELAASAGEAGTTGATVRDDRVARWVERWGYGPTLVLVALLGVALNLTPCVYPLISITLAFFGGRTGTSHTLARALLYAFGICLSFSVLGATAALTGSLFGAALQRPGVLAGIALLLVVLALGNFGLYTLAFPEPLVRRLGRVGEGGTGALVMGLTMGVVAAPCIGPLVAALLVFVGAQQSVLLGLALFFALGLGLGAPYVALAAAAGRLRRLPRGGAWLAWVERTFGFLLLGMALYFAAPLLPESWVRGATALLFTAAAVVLGFAGADGARGFLWARRAGGVALLALALRGLLMAGTGTPIDWMPFSEQALAAAVAAGRPVLIDFEAEWCLPCHEMDRTTFRDPEVVRAAAAFTALKVDVTTGDERATDLMARFEVAGVPTYILLGRDGVERQRLVGFVPAGRMRRALEEIARSA